MVSKGVKLRNLTKLESKVFHCTVYLNTSFIEYSHDLIEKFE